MLQKKVFMSSGKIRQSMSWKSFGIVVASVSLLIGYFEIEKYKMQKKKNESKMTTYGKPLVGGPFSLVDHFGKPVTDLDFRGKYMLIYFGYTFCPDVCPEELERMGKIVDALGRSMF
jgi:protein SCO1/2